MPSIAAIEFTLYIMLLTSFITSPVPSGPTWMTSDVIGSRTHPVASSTAASPPTKARSVPSSAPLIIPETGASSMATPLALKWSAISLATIGSMVLMHSSTSPGEDPSSVPPAPTVTSAVCWVVSTIVMTHFALRATSAGPFPMVAPSDSNSLHTCSSMS